MYSNKNLYKISHLLIALFFLPFCLSFLFSALKYDDSTFVHYKNHGYFEGLKIWFSKENGRYFMALIALLPRLTYWYIYKLIPVLFLAITFISFRLPLNSLGLKKPLTFYLATILTCFIIYSHPTPDEGYTWIPTSIHYILGPCLILIYFSRIISTNNKVIDFVIDFLILFAICGTNELNALATTFGLTSYLICQFLINKTIDKKTLLHLTYCLAFITLSFILLKNSRLENRNLSIDFSIKNLFLSSVDTIIMMLTLSYKWLFEQLYILILLSFALLIPYNKNILRLKLKPTIFILFSINFPVFFLCNISFFAPRILNNVFLIFIFSLLILSISVFQHFNIDLEKHKKKHFIFIIPFSFWIFLYSPNKIFFLEASEAIKAQFPVTYQDKYRSKLIRNDISNAHITVTYNPEINLFIYRIDQHHYNLNDIRFDVKPDKYYKQVFYPKDLNFRQSTKVKSSCFFRHKITTGPKLKNWKKLHLNVIFQNRDTLFTKTYDY